VTIRVLLADDQVLLRQTFRILLDSDPGIQVVAEASDGAQAVDLARTHRPDVVVMDIRMPGTDGLAATRAICADPALGGTRILILTTFETDEYVAHALRAGAGGFLGKDVTAAGLLAAEGHSNDDIAEKLTLSPLTVRTHIHRAMTKLGVRDRAQLVVLAYQTGLVRPAPPR
jgi:DNA-binding NarL/FixJ family response regulator